MQTNQMNQAPHIIQTTQNVPSQPTVVVNTNSTTELGRSGFAATLCQSYVDTSVHVMGFLAKISQINIVCALLVAAVLVALLVLQVD